MRENWLDYLADPVTHESLEMVVFESNGDQIESGYLRTASDRWYPIVNGIPIFVPNAPQLYPGFYATYADRLPSLGEDEATLKAFIKAKAHTQASFGYEWERYNRALPRYDSRYVFEPDLGPDDFSGKVILDAGCGYGRHMKVLADVPGTTVVGVDLSVAVHRAKAILGECDHIVLAQGDLFCPPVKLGVFDWVYSWGVLHHTPDTRKAFEGLIPFAKLGGTVSIKVYQNWFGPAHFAQHLVRRVTCRLPKGLLYNLCYAAVPMNWLYQKVGRFIPVVNQLTRLVIKPNPDWRICHTDTFDWWHPFYNHYHTHAQVIDWFESAGLVDVNAYKPNNVVRGTVTPATMGATVIEPDTMDERAATPELAGVGI